MDIFNIFVAASFEYAIYSNLAATDPKAIFWRRHIRIYARLTPASSQSTRWACAGDNSWKKLILMLMNTFAIGTIDAMGLLNRIVCNAAIDINAKKLNCADDLCIRWTTYQNLSLWFDRYDAFLVKNYGFMTTNQTGKLIIEDKMMGRILNMDETWLSLDRSNGNQGGCPKMTYINVCFPQLGKAMSKSALIMTMINGSTSETDSKVLFKWQKNVLLCP